MFYYTGPQKEKSGLRDGYDHDSPMYFRPLKPNLNSVKVVRTITKIRPQAKIDNFAFKNSNIIIEGLI